MNPTTGPVGQTNVATHNAAAWAAIKLILRQGILFGVPLAVQALLVGVGSHHGYWWGAAGAGLTGIDTYLHKSPLNTNGLVPF